MPAHGLRPRCGNENLYLRLLRKFRDGQRSFADEFRAARTEPTPRRRRAGAHPQGHGGQRGRGGVQAAAGALEKAPRDGEARPLLLSRCARPCRSAESPGVGAAAAAGLETAAAPAARGPAAAVAVDPGRAAAADRAL